MRILNASGSEEVTEALRRLGYREVQECLYREAVPRLAAAFVPDVVVLSPYLGGAEDLGGLIWRLRESNVRVVVLAGDGKGEEAQRLVRQALATGAYDILFNPVRGEDLRRAIEEPATLAEAMEAVRKQEIAVNADLLHRTFREMERSLGKAGRLPFFRPRQREGRADGSPEEGEARAEAGGEGAPELAREPAETISQDGGAWGEPAAAETTGPPSAAEPVEGVEEQEGTEWTGLPEAEPPRPARFFRTGQAETGQPVRQEARRMRLPELAGSLGKALGSFRRWLEAAWERRAAKRASEEVRWRLQARRTVETQIRQLEATDETREERVDRAGQAAASALLETIGVLVRAAFLFAVLGATYVLLTGVLEAMGYDLPGGREMSAWMQHMAALLGVS